MPGRRIAEAVSRALCVKLTLKDGVRFSNRSAVPFGIDPD